MRVIKTTALALMALLMSATAAAAHVPQRHAQPPLRRAPNVRRRGRLGLRAPKPLAVLGVHLAQRLLHLARALHPDLRLERPLFQGWSLFHNGA